MSRFEDSAKKSILEDIKDPDGNNEKLKLESVINNADSYTEPEKKLMEEVLAKKAQENQAVIDASDVEYGREYNLNALPKEPEVKSMGEVVSQKSQENQAAIDASGVEYATDYNLNATPKEPKVKPMEEVLRQKAQENQAKIDAENLEYGTEYNLNAKPQIQENIEESMKASERQKEEKEARPETVERTPNQEASAETKERTLRDLGKEAVAIVMERAKGRWGKFKEKISGWFSWIKEKITGVKIGAEMIAEDASKKYNELKERGAQALNNLGRATKEATGKFFDATINVGLRAYDYMILSQDEEDAQKAFLKAQKKELTAREKVRKQRGKIDRAFLLKNRKQVKLASLEEDLRIKREQLKEKRETLKRIKDKRREIDERLGRERLAEEDF